MFRGYLIVISDPACNSQAGIAGKRRDIGHRVRLADVEKIKRVERRRKGFGNVPVIIVELQQAAPVGIPAGRQVEDHGQPPTLFLIEIVVPGQEMPMNIFRRLGINEIDFIDIGNIPDKGLELLAIQKLMVSMDIAFAILAPLDGIIDAVILEDKLKLRSRLGSNPAG